MKHLTCALAGGAAILLQARVLYAQDLTLDGTTGCPTTLPGVTQLADGSCQMGGTFDFEQISLTNGAVVRVSPYDGVPGNKTTRGNLVLRTVGSIYVDASSSILGSGAGYRARICDNGEAPGTGNDGPAGGLGGCAVRDSGGGGGHFGRGGKGTKDCFLYNLALGYHAATDITCTFPQEWEEGCGTKNRGNGTCTNFGSTTTNVDPDRPTFACYGGGDTGQPLAHPTPVVAGGNGTTPDPFLTGQGDALPSVSGSAFWHHILDVEFGAAGGDKGCRDGYENNSRGGNGGGRIVLFAANAAENAAIDVAGRVEADGNRGCASGNDSAGAGAGGTVLVIGDEVTIESTARITARGGRGGDSQPKCLACTADTDCQAGQTCETFVEARSGNSYQRCAPCNCTPCRSDADCPYPGQTCFDAGGDLDNVCVDTEVTAAAACATSATCTGGDTCQDFGGNLGLRCARPELAGLACTPFDVATSESECAGTQNSGTCDDCAGGGGGGIVSVKSRSASIHPEAMFDVAGGPGGICPICAGESGAGAGELQLDGGYVGEICDGWDDDFDDTPDDDLADLDCPAGATAACDGGLPVDCTYDRDTCLEPSTTSRPRFALILDTSGSMLNDVQGFPTFGDGSSDFRGVDTSADAELDAGDDARLFIAKRAVSRVLAAFPENDYALARYYQDVGVARSCQTASAFECAGSCCSYDDPTNNVAPDYADVFPGKVCVLEDLYPGAGYTFTGADADARAGWTPLTADCINYAGSCGPPERGAQFLVGFDQPITKHLMWLDGTETAFNDDVTPGDHCSGGDCELRATGPTPLAGALSAAASYMTPVATCDGARDCRTYATILLTDGAESCQGDPVAAAAALRNAVPDKEIKTYVIGFSVTDAERAQLNAIAQAGGTDAAEFTGGTDAAFFAQNEDQLANAVATIVASSQVFEVCNDADDDCDTLVDEDFPDKDLPCDDGGNGLCRGTGTRQCRADGAGTECVITDPGATPTDETCNGLDDNCNGLIDEGLDCTDCVPTDEVCDGRDNDCDRSIDEEPDVSEHDARIGVACGELTAPNDQPPCTLGETRCVNGAPLCMGFVGPGEEICNGLDDDCDGEADTLAACPTEGSACIEGRCVVPCSGGEFPCPGGFTCRSGYCISNDCVGVECEPEEVCVSGLCVMRPNGEGGAAGAGGAAGTGGAPNVTGGSAGAGDTSATGGRPPEPPPEHPDAVWGQATGGGGCACSAPLAPVSRAAWLAVALAGLVVGRRRQRAHGGAR